MPLPQRSLGIVLAVTVVGLGSLVAAPAWAVERTDGTVTSDGGVLTDSTPPAPVSAPGPPLPQPPVPTAAALLPPTTEHPTVPEAPLAAAAERPITPPVVPADATETPAPRAAGVPSAATPGDRPVPAPAASRPRPDPPAPPAARGPVPPRPPNPGLPRTPARPPRPLAGPAGASPTGPDAGRSVATAPMSVLELPVAGPSPLTTVSAAPALRPLSPTAPGQPVPVRAPVRGVAPGAVGGGQAGRAAAPLDPPERALRSAPGSRAGVDTAGTAGAGPALTGKAQTLEPALVPGTPGGARPGRAGTGTAGARSLAGVSAAQLPGNPGTVLLPMVMSACVAAALVGLAASRRRRG